MYYNDKGVVDYGHPGDKVYSPRSARVKIFSDEEEYKAFRKPVSNNNL